MDLNFNGSKKRFQNVITVNYSFANEENFLPPHFEFDEMAKCSLIFFGLLNAVLLVVALKKLYLTVSVFIYTLCIYEKL